MWESVRQADGSVPAADVRAAINRQRDMLTDRLTVTMFKAARRLAPLIEIRHALEMLLIDEIEHIPWCRSLYVLDVNGKQVTGNVGRTGVDHGQYARNRAGCGYLRHIIGVSDFRPSDVYFDADSQRPTITAIQVMRDRTMQRVGFLGADHDLRELPYTGAICDELQQWRRLRRDPAIRDGLSGRHPEDSPVDRCIDDMVSLLHELIAECGVFHVTLHFSENRTTVWLAEDPYRYRLLDPDTCPAWPRRPYPDTARVPASLVRPVLERFCRLRMADGHGYLHSGSLNVFNGTIGLDLFCDGSYYLDFNEFLEQDAQSRSGLRCAV
jgi:hypothetical protein